VPFYGRAFGGVAETNQGLYQPHSGRVKNGGESTYRALAARNVGESSTRHWDEEARSPWLYDPATRVMTTYDDPESIRIKARYVRDKGLGGVMFWELSQDDARSSLLGAIHAGLDGE
jgi:chitinase